jgi:hypothetical protein
MSIPIVTRSGRAQPLEEEGDDVGEDVDWRDLV